MISPILDRVVIKRNATKEVSKGGIVIPEAAKQPPLECTVVAVGQGRFDAYGKRIPMNVKVGDVVLVEQGMEFEVKIGDDKHLFIAEQTIMAVIDP